ncbi:MAG: hypothetical protein AAB262_00765 [Elusimicrobiota bacterium]
MKNMVLTAWLMLAAGALSAESLPQALGNDALTKQILSKAAQENGGVTAAVRLGTGQAIELKLADVCCIPIAVRATAPAAKSPTPTPAPAQGLVAKAEKPSPKKPSRAAVVQLKHVSSKAGKSWGEKR